MMELPPGRWVRGGPEYLCETCPNCFKRKHFYWNVNSALGHCQACKIGVVGWFAFVRAFAGELGPVSDWNRQLKMSETKAIPKILHEPKVAPEPARGQEFLDYKGLDLDKAIEGNVSWVEAEKALAVKIDPWSSEYPRQFLYRRIQQEESKWIHLPDVKTQRYGYGLQQHRGTAVVWVEGVFDVLVPSLLGTAVALLGTTFREDAMIWANEQGIEKHIIWLDPDKAGLEGSLKASKILEEWGVAATIFTNFEVLASENALREEKGALPHRWPRNTQLIHTTQEPGDLANNDPMIGELFKLCC